jgi:hypothetical protein
VFLLSHYKQEQAIMSGLSHLESLVNGIVERVNKLEARIGLLEIMTAVKTADKHE